MSKTRRVTTYIQRFKGKILNLFSQSWLTRNIHAEEIHARILIVLYVALLALGIFLFFNFNYVPTRKFDIHIEEIRSYKRDTIIKLPFSDNYECDLSRADISIEIPMTLQPGNNGKGKKGKMEIYMTPNQEITLDKDTHPLYLYKAFKRYKNAKEVFAEFLDYDPNKISAKLEYRPPYYFNSDKILDSLRTECDRHIQPDSLSPYTCYASVRMQTNENFLFHSPGITYNPADEKLSHSVLKGNFNDFTIFSYISKPATKYLRQNLDSDGGILIAPKWTTLADLSQSYYIFSLNSCTFDEMSLSISFIGATNFSRMIPEPDEVGMDCIKFSDPYKIEQIKEEGLKFHTEFSEMKNKQNVRNFALTSLMALVIGAFIKELFVLLYHFMSERRQRKISPDGK